MSQSSQKVTIPRRNIHTRIDLIKENSDCEKYSVEKLRAFYPGNKVQIHNYSNKDHKWNFSSVMERLGDWHYEENVNGQSIKVHVDQIHFTGVTSKIRPDAYTIEGKNFQQLPTETLKYTS